MLDNLCKEFPSIKREHLDNVIKLIEEGNTLPFIARYRKELTGAIDDQLLREVSDRLSYLKNLLKRKEEVAQAIKEAGKFTAEIGLALSKAETLAVVEDIYRPFKEKRKTRAGIAIEKGLQPLADIMLAQEMESGDPEEVAAPYVNEEKEVFTPADALKYALDIVAESISDSADIRAELRAFLYKEGKIKTSFDKKAVEKEDERMKTASLGRKEEKPAYLTYSMYEDYSEPVSAIASHRVLAVNRGEKEGFLKVSLEIDKDLCLWKIESKVITGMSIFRNLLRIAIADSYQRLIFPSLEREIRSALTDTANESAIKTFEMNLEPLLMQPPLKNRRIMGFDPAYRTGCKIAVIDERGNVLATDVVYPTPPQSRIEEAEYKLTNLINKYKVDVISIGNGTASKESEIFVSDLLKKQARKVSYAVVNEAGASVYSASKLGAEEFPDFDVSLRSAVSIARRLLDPLAELIKIDVKSIGVGQYQHDMPQNRLEEALSGVVESCVNNVGVDVNSASVSLLSYVAGLNSGIAKNIIEARKEKPFTNRDELLSVKKLGAKAFEQCAGFLRIQGGENILDNTAVHPESYAAARKLLNLTGYSLDDVKEGNLASLREKTEAIGYELCAQKCGVGVLTLKDIVSELMKPGRDIREDLPEPVLRSELLDITNLKVGMELTGVVRNVTDFGVFVDIGVHQDGLVHKSELADRYVAHPSDIVKVSDVVKVKVIGVDLQKRKIALSMKSGNAPVRDKNVKREAPVAKEPTLAEALAKLKNKYS